MLGEKEMMFKRIEAENENWLMKIIHTVQNLHGKFLSREI